MLLREALAFAGSPSQPAPLELKWQNGFFTQSWWTRTVWAVAELLKILLLSSSWVGAFPPSYDSKENTLRCYKLQGEHYQRWGHLCLQLKCYILGQCSTWPDWAGAVRPDLTGPRWINSTSTLQGSVCKPHKHCRVKTKKTPQMLDCLQRISMAATNSPSYNTSYQTAWPKLCSYHLV